MKQNFQIADMRHAAALISELLKSFEQTAEAGMSLRIFEEMAEAFIKQNGLISCNKNYQPSWAQKPYPSVLCASVNEEAVHCPPTDYKLKEGDIVTFDIGFKYRTACADSALTICIGPEVDKEKMALVYHTKKALELATSMIKPGVSNRAIGLTIDHYVKSKGLRVCPQVCGHGIGASMHEQPLMPNWDDPSVSEVRLQEGMVLCLEPIITIGQGEIEFEGDGWITKSKDKQPVAQFENMVLVTHNGFEELTTHLQN